MYGGAISAILINTPGTPAASCTMLDGYPLAKKGKAREALEMSLYASCFGDLVSTFVLIASASWLASFALDFGPSELFALVVFALVIVAGIAAQQMVKGFLSMVLGLALATVGMDMITGEERFVFGATSLNAGLSLVPVLIGLFALPEVFQMYSGNKENQEIAVLGKKGLGVKGFFKYWRTLLRSSCFGVILGVIPGLGPTPAAFFSYGEAKRKAADPDSFGKGNIEGVAAAESANSAVGGASMVPLLALGIPADVITAVILGAFMIHGLQPGPLMFQSNIDIIYSLFMGMLAGSALLFLIGKASIPMLGRLLHIRPSLLLPGVLVLCVFGAYGVNKSMFDIMIMFTMGVLGHIMVTLHFSRAPMLIGFVLGPLLENSFRQSLLMSQGELGFFVASHISKVFWILTLVYLGAMIYKSIRQKLRKNDGVTPALTQ
ncbi:tripartite tricarboxylate transporter permease [Paenalcaligenes niemegkensis]|nr:tripartite tricarboxylate transporter permease [Paenalcaligenes niemegkensis]MCQ9617809.1 tripartite tricarboxylate transporter permease [Paenalcaligenes niemegkensis]